MPQKRAPRGSKTGSSPVKKNRGSNIGKTKTVNAKGKRPRNNDEYVIPFRLMPDTLPLPSLRSSSDPASPGRHDDNKVNGNSNNSTSPSPSLSLPPPSPTADEDALNVPASQELRNMLIHYGVIARENDYNDHDQDDESIDDGDDRSGTMMLTNTATAGGGDDAEGSSRKKAKKNAKKTTTTGVGAAGGMVKVEMQGDEEGYGFEYGDHQGQGGEEGGYDFGAFGGDGAGEYAAGWGAVFA